ncbi:uncharacterized protein LOC144746889 [Ciona intestinalis]
MEAQRGPDSVHCSILPNHIKSCDEWISDLKQSVEQVKKNGSNPKNGTSAIYGMLSMVPSDGIVDNFLVDLFDEIYKT